MSKKTANADKQPKRKKGATPAPEDAPPTESTAPAEEMHTSPRRLSALDAAAKVLVETGQALGCKEMIERMAANGYWTSPGGKTPEATLYSAILRELKVKGGAARFQKVERGKFKALERAAADPKVR